MTDSSCPAALAALGVGAWSTVDLRISGADTDGLILRRSAFGGVRCNDLGVYDSRHLVTSTQSGSWIGCEARREWPRNGPDLGRTSLPLR